MFHSFWEKISKLKHAICLSAFTSTTIVYVPIVCTIFRCQLPRGFDRSLTAFDFPEFLLQWKRHLLKRRKIQQLNMEFKWISFLQLTVVNCPFSRNFWLMAKIRTANSITTSSISGTSNIILNNAYCSGALHFIMLPDLDIWRLWNISCKMEPMSMQ